MIDSVVLELKNSQYKLRAGHKFDGAKAQRGKGFNISSFYCEGFAKQQRKQGLYFPVINLPKRKVGHEGVTTECLTVQVSLPKLLYATNLFETDEQDLDKIFIGLAGVFGQVGVETSSNELAQAVIRKVDFCKIIKLPDYLGRADEVIYNLFGFNYKTQSDFSLKELRDGREGVYIKFLNTTQGYVIYDKLSEIVNNGYTQKEQIIKDAYLSGQLRNNALKFELALHRKDSLEAVLRRRITGKKKDFVLGDILNRDLVRGIMLDKFNDIFGKVTTGLISLSEMEDNKLRAYLDDSNLSLVKQQKLYYWVRMATKNGIAGVWEQINRKCKGGSVGKNKKLPIGD